MKKDRNCGMAPYPIYPPYQGMNPGMMPNMGPMPVPNMPNQMMIPSTNMNYQVDPGVSSNTIEQQLNTLQEEVNALQRRVSSLESLYNQANTSTNKYNSSNYQMM